MDDAPRITHQLDWRDLAENAAARSSERRQRGWLEMLAREWEAHGDRAFRALYQAILEDLAQGGASDTREWSRAAAEAAKRELRARRAMQQAYLELLAAVGRIERVEQRDVAASQGISARTAQYDLARARSLVADGSMARAASRPLPPVPVPPEGRIRPSRSRGAAQRGRVR